MQLSLLRPHSLQLALQLALLPSLLLQHQRSRGRVQTQTVENHQRLSQRQLQPHAGGQMPTAAQLHQIGRTVSPTVSLRQPTRRRTTVWEAEKRQWLHLQLRSRRSPCGIQTTQQRQQRGSGTWHGRSGRPRSLQSRFLVDRIDQTWHCTALCQQSVSLLACCASQMALTTESETAPLRNLVTPAAVHCRDPCAPAHLAQFRKE